MWHRHWNMASISNQCCGHKPQCMHKHPHSSQVQTMLAVKTLETCPDCAWLLVCASCVAWRTPAFGRCASEPSPGPRAVLVRVMYAYMCHGKAFAVTLPDIFSLLVPQTCSVPSKSQCFCMRPGTSQARSFSTLASNTHQSMTAA